MSNLEEVSLFVFKCRPSFKSGIRLVQFHIVATSIDEAKDIFMSRTSQVMDFDIIEVTETMKGYREIAT